MKSWQTPSHHNFTERTQSTVCFVIATAAILSRQPHTANMSDSGEVEVEVPQTNAGNLPKEVAAEAGSIKLFNKWSYEDVEIRDISLTYAEPLHCNPSM